MPPVMVTSTLSPTAPAVSASQVGNPQIRVSVLVDELHRVVVHLKSGVARLAEPSARGLELRHAHVAGVVDLKARAVDACLRVRAAVAHVKARRAVEVEEVGGHLRGIVRGLVCPVQPVVEHRRRCRGVAVGPRDVVTRPVVAASDVGGRGG